MFLYLLFPDFFLYSLSVKCGLLVQDKFHWDYFIYSFWYPFWTNSYSENNQFCNFVVVIVQSLSCVQHFETHGLQFASLPSPSLSSKVWSVSCPLIWWCYLTNSSSASLFSFCFQSFPESGSFPMRKLKLPIFNLKNNKLSEWTIFINQYLTFSPLWKSSKINKENF